LNIKIVKEDNYYFARLLELGHAVVGDGDTIEEAVFNLLLCYQMYKLRHEDYEEEDFL
jgi:predicted RNase H-like HicB family nuclease